MTAQRTSIIRYVWFDQVSHARPVTVVEDRDDLIALFLAPGTVCKSCLSDGNFDTYNATLLSRRWDLSDHKWHTNRVLMLARPGEWCSIWGFYDETDGALRFWYCNLETPITRSELGYDTRDLQLDIVISPDLSWRWKDEAEFARMCDVGLITPDDARRTRAEGERVIELIERGDTWWLEWKDWAPDPSWTIPDFVDGWDQV